MHLMHIKSRYVGDVRTFLLNTPKPIKQNNNITISAIDALMRRSKKRKMPLSQIIRVYVFCAKSSRIILTE